MEPQPAVVVRSVNFVRTFPWLRISQAIGCALAPQPVVLCVVVALVLTLLQMTLFHAVEPRSVVVITGAGITISLSDLVRPVSDVWQPLLMARGGGWVWLRLIEAVVVVAVWTLSGVAIARCAAVQFCREESPSFRGAVQWSLARLVASLTAILTPLGGAALLLVIAAVIAIPAATPGLGLVWLQVAAPVQFGVGVVAGFILLMLPVLWPLMVAAVAVEGSDAFDAFSRSFSLVTSRLWSTLGLLLMTGISAFVLTLAFRLLLDVSLEVVLWSAAWTTSNVTTDRMVSILGWWRDVGHRGLCGSLFWTHVTIVYLFLREQVDAVPVFQLSGYDDARPPAEPYPVVGMSAVAPSDQSLKATTGETNLDLGGEG